MKAAAIWLGVLLACGCSDRPKEQTEQWDASRARRVFQPPSGEVRAVPPHAIHAEGVGPYLLGADLKDILELQPRGPRVVLMEIDGLLDYSLVRAESDSLVIGVQRPGGVSFVGVLDEEVARTETGQGVGATLAELREALGPPVPFHQRPRDPRIASFDELPNIRFVLSDEQVRAVVVGRPGRNGERGAGDDEPACRAQKELGDHEDAIVEAAGAAPAEATVTYGCLSGNGAEALVSHGDRVVVVGGEPERLRRLASHRAPGVSFATPIDVDGDGRQAVAVVSETRTEAELQVTLELARVEGGQLARIASQSVYRLSANAAAWIGATLEDVELLLELEGHAGNVEVGGLYVHRPRSRVVTVAPLTPQVVTLRHRRSGGAAPEHDAGPPGDAGTGGDAGGDGHDTGDAGPAREAP